MEGILLGWGEGMLAHEQFVQQMPWHSTPPHQAQQVPSTHLQRPLQDALTCSLWFLLTPQSPASMFWNQPCVQARYIRLRQGLVGGAVLLLRILRAELQVASLSELRCSSSTCVHATKCFDWKTCQPRTNCSLKTSQRRNSLKSQGEPSHQETMIWFPSKLYRRQWIHKTMNTPAKESSLTE